MSEPLSISPADLAPADGRFDRFALIGWWDQSRLASARVLVIGAGALGNEIVKNLALLGVGNVLIADKDRIENSNLSRSVLYRAEDAGNPKAVVAAAAAKRIYPDIHVHAFDGDVINDLGAGVYRWADVVIGGLDNREARLAINRQAWRLNRPWIDGAIEVIQGVARVFTPDAKQQQPCYECTMSERDWKVLAHRRSCNLLTRAEMEGGRVPTTPTIGSIIAGVQVQEAVKLLHNLDTLAGKAFVFAGDSADSYQITYQRKADCQSHDTLGRVIELDAGVDTLTPADLLDLARQHLGPAAVVDLGRDIAESLVCKKCGRQDEVFRSLSKLTTADAHCPHCGDPGREVVTFSSITDAARYEGRTLRQIGVPAFDVLTARTKEDAVGFELTADRAAVLGPLAETGEEGLEWT